MSAWSDQENLAIASAYLEMLVSLMRGDRVVKSQVNRALREDALRARSRGSVDFKFQNLSAALVASGFPWVDGYKPAKNFQASLQDIAIDLVNQTKLFETTARAAYDSFQAGVDKSGLAFSPEFVRAFLASLATKRFVILTGLSGSGKTQIALRFGQWLGDEQHLIIPVRPDWTGAEALFGYEDALLPVQDGRRAWHVPRALRFMLDAAKKPDNPFLMVLDEMNLAHVERYFADVLSGMESGEACLPNLAQEDDGFWRIPPAGPAYLPFPDNLFVIGTVNVDETTYMFSPKVLDRANTLEFRVATDALNAGRGRPKACPPAPAELSRGFLDISRNDAWGSQNPHPEQAEFARQIKLVHSLLSESGYEFGHRVFYEAIRFAALLNAAGEGDIYQALDFQILQKVLPRLHGSRRQLEPTLIHLARFCYDLSYEDGAIARGDIHTYELPAPSDEPARLARSFDKLRRMLQKLRANQFVSFSE